MSQISTCLWFDNQAEPAADFYLSVFKDARRLDTIRSTDGGPGEQGSVPAVTFRIDGYEIVALNGGPHYRITPADLAVREMRDPG